MKRPNFSLGDLLAAANKNMVSSRSRTQVPDETDDSQKQLADAGREAQNALAEWRSYPNPYYELASAEAVAKVQRLEAKTPKRKATSGDEVSLASSRRNTATVTEYGRRHQKNHRFLEAISRRSVRAQRGCHTCVRKFGDRFEVALLVHAASYTVCYATWHTECSEEEMAMNAFINGLSDRGRLIVVSRGNVDYRWTAQIRRPEGWTTGDTVGIFRCPFWKARTIRHLQNNYFIAEKPQSALTWPDLNRSTWRG